MHDDITHREEIAQATFIALAAEGLVAFVSLGLFLGMLAVWAAIGSGA